MAHVFKLHTSGINTLDGWDNSTKYDQNVINDIVDPAGATAKLPITSVPTPFASLELVRSAYKECSKQPQGDTIFHKLVSFSLDTLEILFSFNRIGDKFEIIAWDAYAESQQLMESIIPSHRQLGQTLNLYLNQNADTFNFARGTVFYLLNYKYGPAPLNIVGGTSTTSLTVASTNDLSYVDVPLSGNHSAYDEDTESFRSLNERDFEFFKYVWTLSLQPNFSVLYPEVYEYIQQCFRAESSQENKQALLAIQPTDIEYYEPLIVGAAKVMIPGDICLGTFSAPSPARVSDFTILSDFGDKLPLVLPNETGFYDPDMRYITGPWDKDKKAPYYDSLPMEKRILPADGTVYPYLTADDIFQPYIIKSVFPIDQKSYFLAHLDDKKNSYLIPLKKEIFKYMSVETLRGRTGGMRPQKIFELKSLAGGGVEAVIRIPVQKQKYIEMRRRYLLTDDDPDIINNKGTIVECNFDLYLFPSYHIASHLYASTPQRVYLIDGDWRQISKHFEYNVELFKSEMNFGKNLVETKILRADKNRNDGFSSMIFVANKEFDVIQVSNGTACGMLIPYYEEVGYGNDQYEFAIDFGTTNTHVEYRIKGGNIDQPLEMLPPKSAVLSMHPRTEEYEVLFREKQLNMFIDNVYQEFLPSAFGNNEITGFPLRTNLCVTKQEGEGDNLRVKRTVGDYSIGFHYEKYRDNPGNRTITNLKWLGDGNAKYVHSFLEELLMIIRSKVLMDGGSLKDTKITWFYPISMESYRLSQLRDEWSELCETLIGPNCNMQSVTESLAPFYYYKNSEGVNAAYRPVVLMDIGGGTTDFAVYQENKPVLVSSVRFAGNSIYGDFPGFGMSMNGFYKRYCDKFRTMVASTGLRNIFEDVVNSGVSADFVSFLYSLEKNADLRKKNIFISFSETLKKDYPMKTTLLIFFASEIYYLASILKEKNIGTPAYLTVSGTGSKVLDLLGGQKELESLAKIIFNDVIGDDGKVELKRVKNPKEITCKGGLNIKPADIIDDIDEYKFCYTASSSIEKRGKKHFLRDVDESASEEVMQFYHKFIEYFFSLNAKFSFEKKFGIQTQKDFEKYKEILLEHAREDLAAVLDVRRSEHDDPDAELEDSLFFYPMAGGLNRLSSFIAESKVI